MSNGRVYYDIVTINGVNVIAVTSDPSGVLTQPIGTLALRADIGSVSTYQNTDGGTSWSVLTGGLSGQLPFTTKDVLAIGDIIIIDTDGEAQLADNTTVLNKYYPQGVAVAAALVAATVSAYVVPGQLVPVRFAVAPAAGLNGSPVFLGTAGEGTMTAPTTSGTAVVRIGILVAANGISTTPDVLMQLGSPTLIA